MTDRHSAYIVILESDIREDDAEATIAAIKQIRGVLTVEPHLFDPDERIAEARVRRELTGKIFSVLYPKEQA